MWLHLIAHWFMYCNSKEHSNYLSLPSYTYTARPKSHTLLYFVGPPSAMSQHFFPSRVALIFQNLVGMMGESFPAHPKDWEWGKGLDSMVANPCVIVSSSLNHSFTIWARWIWALSSWNMPMSSGKKKIHWWNILVKQYIQVVRWPHSLGS